MKAPNKLLVYRGVKAKGSAPLRGDSARTGSAPYWTLDSKGAAIYAGINNWSKTPNTKGGIWVGLADRRVATLHPRGPKRKLFRGLGHVRVDPSAVQKRFVPYQRAWASHRGPSTVRRRAIKETSGRADAVRKAWATRKRRYGKSGVGKTGGKRKVAGRKR